LDEQCAAKLTIPVKFKFQLTFNMVDGGKHSLGKGKCYLCSQLL
jgi:hypothetical protein